MLAALRLHEAASRGRARAWNGIVLRDHAEGGLDVALAEPLATT